MNVQVEVSYYPLARPDVNDCIKQFCSILSKKGLSVTTNAMSSVVNGDTANVMHSLADAIEAVGHESKFVVVCKISNACHLEYEGDCRKS